MFLFEETFKKEKKKGTVLSDLFLATLKNASIWFVTLTVAITKFVNPLE